MRAWTASIASSAMQTLSASTALATVIMLLLVSVSHTVWADSYEDLLRAREMGDLPAVQRLLTRGVDINTTDKNGNTLLMLSARDNQRDLLQWLLAQRASVRKKNRQGDDALMLAALKGHRQAAQALLAAGADVNPPGWTPLIYAAFEGWIEMLQLLLQQGAKINAQAPNGMAALMVASRNGELAAVKFLLERGADPELRDQQGRTALEIAQAAARSKEAPARAADVAHLLEKLQPEPPVVLRIQKASPAVEWADGNPVTENPDALPPRRSQPPLQPEVLQEDRSHEREFEAAPALKLRLQSP